MIDLNELAKKCKEISDKRIANGSVESDVLKHCAGEVVEAVEAREFLLHSFDDYEGIKAKNNYAYELADIIICALIAFSEAGIEPEKYLLEKININEKRAKGEGDKL